MYDFLCTELFTTLLITWNKIKTYHLLLILDCDIFWNSSIDHMFKWQNLIKFLLRSFKKFIHMTYEELIHTFHLLLKLSSIWNDHYDVWAMILQIVDYWSSTDFKNHDFSLFEFNDFLIRKPSRRRHLEDKFLNLSRI